MELGEWKREREEFFFFSFLLILFLLFFTASPTKCEPVYGAIEVR